MNRSRPANASSDALPAPTGSLHYAWRIVAAGVCFTVFGLGTLLMTALLLLVVRPMPGVSQARKSGWVQVAIRRLARFFIDMMQAFGLMRYRVEHAERLRLPGRLIVANHPSLIDALFILGYSPGLCCIVKRGLLDNPFTSWLARSAGYLANDSDSLIEDAAQVLKGGRSLLVFPEGTRNRCDSSLHFKRGAAHVAIAAGIPLTPVTIDFSPRALQKGDPWYAVPRPVSRIRVRVHAPIDVVEHARVSLDAHVPVTLLARRVTAGLRDWYTQRVIHFANPQGPSGPLRSATSHGPGDLVGPPACTTNGLPNGMRP